MHRSSASNARTASGRPTPRISRFRRVVIALYAAGLVFGVFTFPAEANAPTPRDLNPKVHEDDLPSLRVSGL